MKLFILLLILSVPLSSAEAAGRQEEGGITDLKILYVPGVADPFYHSMEAGARDEALRLGISLDTADYPLTWDTRAQLTVLRNALDGKQYDLVMIAPVDNEALIEPLKELDSRGISIITVDTKLGDGDYSTPSAWDFPLCHIGTDNFAGAVALAEYLAEQVGEKGKVYINTTTAETSTTEERKSGFIEGISHFPEMEMVGVDYNGDLQDIAQAQTLEALIANPDLVAVFGTNVFSSQGVSAAVKNTGLSGAVKVAAWDATETLIDSLKEGEVDLVLAQKPAEIGALAVEWAYKGLSEGRSIPSAITSGYVIFTRANVHDPGMEDLIY